MGGCILRKFLGHFDSKDFRAAVFFSDILILILGDGAFAVTDVALIDEDLLRRNVAKTRLNSLDNILLHLWVCRSSSPLVPCVNVNLF